FMAMANAACDSLTRPPVSAWRASRSTAGRCLSATACTVRHPRGGRTANAFNSMSHVEVFVPNRDTRALRFEQAPRPREQLPHEVVHRTGVLPDFPLRVGSEP